MINAINNHFQRHKTGILTTAYFFLMVLYVYGAARQHIYVNIDMTATDQRSYMNAAQAMRESNYTYMTGRNRMPVYPFLQSLLYTPGMSDEAFFSRGKTANIILSLGILAVLLFVFRRYLPLFTAVNLYLITAFFVFIFKAAYFQVELLFYFLNFLMYLLLCLMLIRPSWKRGIVTGSVIGLTHLTKASVLPALILFTATISLKFLISLLQAASRQHTKTAVRVILLPTVLVILTFLLTVWPYIRNSKAQFGHYFYNVNSTFYIWYDSWEEVESGTKAYGDREHWPDMPSDAIPSAAKYLREHSAAQLWQRLADGFFAILGNTVYSYGYVKYMLLYTFVLLLLVVTNRTYTYKLLKQHFFLILFNGGYFVGYLVLYIWYGVIMAGNRLILAQFLPYMFVVSYAIYHLYQQHLSIQLSRHSQRMVNLGQAFNLFILLLVLVDIAFVLTNRITSIYGGF